MRRTITTLMFLAVGGLAFAARAADPGSSSGNWSYYAAGQSHYKISDDDGEPASSGASGSSSVSTAVGKPQVAGQEKNALYIAEKNKSAGELLQTNYFSGSCCQDACSCDNNCNNSCLSDCCCDCSCNSFRFEWLGFFSRGRNTPTLVTTSPAGTSPFGPPSVAGTLGANGTAVLYGDDPIGTNLRNGGRATLNVLLRDGITTGTVRFWGIEDGSETFATNSNVNGIIAIPFIQVLPGLPPPTESAFLVAGNTTNPAVTTAGSIAIVSKNDIIGGDAWVSRNWYGDGSSSIDLLAGYQFARLDDSLAISSSSVPVLGPPSSTFDSFLTQNEFHGGSGGILARSYRGPVTLEGLFKFAAGDMRERVTVAGSNTAAGVTTPGGFFAQGTNSGTQQHHHFTTLTEINTNLVYNVNSNWRLVGGYSFIYWGRVLLAGNQIDRQVNTTQLFGGQLIANTPAEARPAPKFQRTDFWVQGVNVGLDYRW